MFYSKNTILLTHIKYCDKYTINDTRTRETRVHDTFIITIEFKCVSAKVIEPLSILTTKGFDLVSNAIEDTSNIKSLKTKRPRKQSVAAQLYNALNI